MAAGNEDCPAGRPPLFFTDSEYAYVAFAATCAATLLSQPSLLSFCSKQRQKRDDERCSSDSDDGGSSHSFHEVAAGQAFSPSIWLKQASSPSIWLKQQKKQRRRSHSSLWIDLIVGQVGLVANIGNVLGVWIFKRCGTKEMINPV